MPELYYHKRREVSVRRVTKNWKGKNVTILADSWIKVHMRNILHNLISVIYEHLTFRLILKYVSLHVRPYIHAGQVNNFRGTK